MTYPTNRWFTRQGRKKRVPEYLEPFRKLIPEPTVGGQVEFLLLIRNLRIAYPHLSLSEGRDLAVYLYGLYDNGRDTAHIPSPNMTHRNFESGAQLFLSIIALQMKADDTTPSEIEAE